MAEKWTVGQAVARQVSGTPCWEVSLVRPDGGTIIHLMPAAILDWRAAEFGIDPTDVETLLEVVLHEPHMPMTDDAETGPRFADDGPDLWTADNTVAARESHLARVQACPVQIGVRNVNALAAIRTGHRPDLEQVRAMREAVDTSRWLKKYGDLPAPPIPEVLLTSGRPTPSIPTPLRRP